MAAIIPRYNTPTTYQAGAPGLSPYQLPGGSTPNTSPILRSQSPRNVTPITSTPQPGTVGSQPQTSTGNVANRSITQVPAMRAPQGTGGDPRVNLTAITPENSYRNMFVTPPTTQPNLTSPEALRARELSMGRLEGLDGPDRGELANRTFSLIRSSTDPDYQRELRGVGQKAAAWGRIGAGMTTNDLGDVQSNRERYLADSAERLSIDAAGQSLDDRLSALSATLGAQGQFTGEDLDRAGMEFGQGQAIRNEYRDERDYANLLARYGVEDEFTREGLEQGRLGLEALRAFAPGNPGGPDDVAGDGGGSEGASGPAGTAIRRFRGSVGDGAETTGANNTGGAVPGDLNGDGTLDSFERRMYDGEQRLRDPNSRRGGPAVDGNMPDGANASALPPDLMASLSGLPPVGEPEEEDPELANMLPGEREEYLADVAQQRTDRDARRAAESRAPQHLFANTYQDFETGDQTQRNLVFDTSPEAIAAWRAGGMSGMPTGTPAYMQTGFTPGSNPNQLPTFGDRQTIPPEVLEALAQLLSASNG